VRHSLRRRHDIEEVGLFTHPGACEWDVGKAVAEYFEWRVSRSGGG
jgi:hypothetical protein